MGFDLNLLGDRVAIEPHEPERISRGGVHLPDDAREKLHLGTVVGVGPGHRDEQGNLVPVPVTEGDEVLYARYAGTEVKVDGDAFLILREADVLATRR